MDLETAKAWMQGVNMLGTFALGIWMYLERRSDKTNERVAELWQRLEQTDRAVSALKTTAQTAPTHGDIARVYDSLNTLAGTVNQLVGENRGQTDTLRLILNQITQKGLQ